MPLWVRPAAAAGPLTLRARPGSGKQSARAGSTGPGGPLAPGCPQQGARTHAFPGGAGVRPRAAGEDSGAERGTAQELGATQQAGTQVSAVRALTAGHRAQPLWPWPWPWVGRREERAVFQGRLEEPRCLALAGAWTKHRCRECREAQSAPAPRHFSKPTVLSGFSGFLVPRCPPSLLRRLQPWR